MKKLLVMMIAVVLTGCSKTVVDDGEVGCENRFTFHFVGDFGGNATRSTNLDESSMTDFWLYDFMDGDMVLAVHLTPDDDDWGAPAVTLKDGEHHLYFVASAGVEPTEDDDNHTIVWEKVKDTFWKSMTLDVDYEMSRDQVVTMSRAVTRLSVNVSDRVPEGMATLSLTPATWYNGLNYLTGAPIVEEQQAHSVNVPASYIGTSGTLSFAIFGFSSMTEWTTDVTVTAKNSDGEVIGQSVIHDAPFVRNRKTEYTGRLFTHDGDFSIFLDDDWSDSYQDTF